LKVIVHSDLPHHDPEADIETERWGKLAQQALTTENITEGELSIFFVDERTIASLNEAHMGETGPTDVLAFPIDGPESAANQRSTRKGHPPQLLGDIFVCPVVARRNANEHGKLFEDEVALLVIHGVLHILGHDHAEDEEKRIMQQREKILLADHHQS
tara:strand:- start:65 stop:538 length:474 start_codon:yes stop_codon:yes gene_type:complete